MAEHVRRARQLTTAIGLTAALMIAIAACSSDSSDDLPPPASPGNEPAATTPAETLDSRDAEAWEELQTIFDGFMETWIKWAAEGSPGGFENPSTAEIGEYATDDLQNDVRVELSQQLQDGHVKAGRPTWRDPKLLELDWDRTVQVHGEDVPIPQAVFEVCVDDSEWAVVDAESGEQVGSDSGDVYMWTMTARLAEDLDFGPDVDIGPEGWALVRRDVDEDRPC